MKRMIEDTVLFDIGDALREKHNTDRRYQDNEMAQAVRDIQSGDDSLAIGLIQRDLTEVNIPKGTTSIGEHAFSNCKNLTNITIPDSVTNIGAYAFQGCSSLTEINLPDSITSINGYAFYYCTSLKEFTIPDKVTSLTYYTFGNSGIEKINFGSGLKIMGFDSFRAMKITELIIPNSVVEMGERAVYQCQSLFRIYLPNSLQKIADTNFYACDKLQEVILEEGFNCSINLSRSTKYSRETIVSWFEALADRTGLEANKLIINKQSESLLSEEDLAIPVNKNWTIVFSVT